MPRTKALTWTAQAHVEPSRPWVTQARAVCGAPSEAFVGRLLHAARRSRDVPRPGQVREAVDLAETVLALGCPGVVFLRPLHKDVGACGGVVAWACVPSLQPAPVDPEAVIAAAIAEHGPDGPGAFMRQQAGQPSSVEEARAALPVIRALWARAVAEHGVRSAR